MDPQEAKKVAEKQQETAIFDQMLQPLKASLSLTLDCDNEVDSLSALTEQFLGTADSMLKDISSVASNFFEVNGWLSRLRTPQIVHNEGQKQANIRNRLRVSEGLTPDPSRRF